MPISPENFNFVRDLTRQTAAIILEDGKEYLVEMRLDPIYKQAGYADINAFVDELRKGKKKDAFLDSVVDALTTNETFFFRDLHPFEALRTHTLPLMIKQRADLKKITLWSAASSTGQEAYSLAMIILEHFPNLRDWNISIIGTDFSSTVLAQAVEGSYSQLEVNRGLPAVYLIKYFEKKGNRWQVKEAVRKMVQFKQMNLIKPWPILPQFDIVFIRNVLIYFDLPTKASIVKKIRTCLNPNGFLFLGAAESLLNMGVEARAEQLNKTTCYQLS